MWSIFGGEKFPTRAWLNEAAQIPQYTPDMWRLEQHANVLLFDYGLVNGAKPECSAFTCDRFAVLKQHLKKATFPVAFNWNVDAPRHRVCGSLYQLTPFELARIDYQKQNGVFYTRRKVKIIVPQDKDQPFSDHNGNPIELSAWMYGGCKSHWGPMLDWDRSFYRGREGSVFSPVTVIKSSRPWLDTYYHFTKSDFEGTRIVDERSQQQDSRAA